MSFATSRGSNSFAARDKLATSPLKSVRFNPPAICMKLVPSMSQGQIKVAFVDLPSINATSLSGSKSTSALDERAASCLQTRLPQVGTHRTANSSVSTKSTARNARLMAKQEKLEQELKKSRQMVRASQRKNRKVHQLSGVMYKEQLKKIEDFKAEQQIWKEQAEKRSLQCSLNQAYHEVDRKRIMKEQRRRQREIYNEYHKRAMQNKRPEHKARTCALDLTDAEKMEEKLIEKRKQKNVAQLQRKLHQRIRQHGTLQQTFKVFDMNGDGRWSPEEFKRVLKMIGCSMMTTEDQHNLLDHVSADGDKYITFDELESFLGIPPSKNKEEKAGENERKEKERRKHQSRQSLTDEPLLSFLERENHGRKPFRWYDDE